jgi:predicted metalloprotease with PDZ domain
MQRTGLHHRIWIGLFVAYTATCASAQSLAMTIEVDARDLPRKLLHARITLPVAAGEARFAFPKWMPGTHAASGPVQNIAGLRFATPDGKPLEWKRDNVEMWQFYCAVPAGVTSLVIDLDYICSQPSVNSRGIDSFSNALIGVINWNTCLVYPVAAKPADVTATMSLRLPDGWKYATALETANEHDGVVSFKPEPLDEVIDSPLICGEHLRTIPLEQDFRPAMLHLVSESESATNLKPELIAKYANVVAEAGALFQSAPYDAYHFLVTCSNDLPENGLEHRRSSLNGVGERDLLEDDRIKGWVGYLLPHEFAHAWCGKYRRPAGMVTGDFHTPQRTEMLWYYEGLAQYLGEILNVRAGVWDLDHYKRLLADDLSFLRGHTGRAWRPLEDTAVASATLRERSKSWDGLRRNQDYYDEGKLLWLEMDAMIRDATSGAKSLDDFCRSFFAVRPEALPVSPFTFDELCTALNDVSPFDWKRFIESRIEKPQETLPMDVVARIGYRLQYANETPENIKKKEADQEYVAALDSLGADVENDGTIHANIVSRSPLDRAKLAPGTKIIGVNGRKFSKDRLKDAIRDSVARGNVELLVLNGDTYRTVTLDYKDGLRYLELVRDESRPDYLAAICTPRAKAHDQSRLDGSSAE